MDRKDFARLQRLEKFVEYVASALEIQSQLQKDREKNSPAYMSAMSVACLLGIKRELKKVKK